MILRHTILNAKKSVLCLIACLLGSQAEAQDAPAEKAARQPSTEDRFEVRNLEGWTLYINRDVPRQYPEQTAKTLEHLGWELYQIKLAAPALAVRNLQENNAIWIEYQEKVDLSYHPDRSWLLGLRKEMRKEQSWSRLSCAKARCTRVARMAKTFGCRTAAGRLHSNRSGRVSRRRAQFGLSLVAQFPGAGVGRADSAPSVWSPPEAHGGAVARGVGVDRAKSSGFRLCHTPVDRAAVGPSHSDSLGRRFAPALSQCVVESTEDHSAGADAGSPRAQPRGCGALGGRNLASHKKRARAWGAALMFTDESGFLMAPARRTTLAPRGHTPVLPQRAAHRQKVSVAAALWKTPGRELPRLHYGTYPNMFLDAEDYVEFLIEILQYWPSNQPAIILHDEGGLHLGEPMDDFLDDHPLVEVELLPPYAPELNPVEAIWNHLKLDRMANFAPLDVANLDVVLEDNLWKVQHDTNRLRTFFAASPLEW